MSGPNLDPIFSKAPDVQVGQGVIGPTAVTAQDGTGNLVSIFQADATNGGYVEGVILRPVGSPVLTVARLFLCSVTGAFTSGSSNTASNTNLIAEATCVAVTLSQTAAAAPVYLPVGFAIPAGYRLLLGFGTSTGAAGTGYVPTPVGGKY
jgi:hypothetical protein